jgi:ribosomal protein S18 acetylase RimI-like enzyme
MMQIQSMCYPSALVESEEIFESMLDTTLVLVLILQIIKNDEQDDENAVIGYLLAHPWHDITQPPKLHKIHYKMNCDYTYSYISTCFFLHDLTIHPMYQRTGLGLGTRLVNESIACFSNKLPLCLVAVNNTASGYWSKKHGFQKVACDADTLESYGDTSATYMVLEQNKSKQTN